MCGCHCKHTRRGLARIGMMRTAGEGLGLPRLEDIMVGVSAAFVGGAVRQRVPATQVCGLPRKHGSRSNTRRQNSICWSNGYLLRRTDSPHHRADARHWACRINGSTTARRRSHTQGTLPVPRWPPTADRTASTRNAHVPPVVRPRGRSCPSQGGSRPNRSDGCGRAAPA